MSRSQPLRLRDYLEHVEQAILRIGEYTQAMDLQAYSGDHKTQDAVIRNLEVIGEACNNVARHHPAFAESNPAVPWSFAYEMRNALSHGYFKVDHNIVWRTLQADLPVLLQAVKGMLDSRDLP